MDKPNSKDNTSKLDKVFQAAGTTRQEMENIIRDGIWGGRPRKKPIEWRYNLFQAIEKADCLEEYRAFHDEIKRAIITKPLGNL